MRHPFEKTSADNRWAVFLPLLLLTLIVMAVLNVIGIPLNTEAAPQGIISYELAGNVPTAQAILDSWDSRARVHAGFSLGFDFLFLALYSITIAYACVWVAHSWRDSRRKPAFMASLGLLLAWGQWLAGFLDGVENTALWIVLSKGAASPWPQIARWCAVVKFALVILGIVYALLGGPWVAMGKRTREGEVA